MRFNVEIVMSTTVDWQALNRVCQSSLLKEFDAKGINPHSYQGFCQVANTPFVEQYISVGFAITIPGSRLDKIKTILPPKTFKLEEEDDVILISFGNIYEWRQSIVAGCNSDLAELFNKIYDQFVSSGFSQVFKGYKQLYQGNGTFKLWQNI